MESTVFRVLATALLLGGLAVTSGCAAMVAAGAVGTGVYWHRGELTATYNASVPDVISAAEASLDEMNITLVSKESDEYEGRIVGRTAGDTRVRISADRKAERVTDVAIRIGTFGDQDRSVDLHNRIRERLGLQE